MTIITENAVRRSVTIQQPDDMHLHLRDGDALRCVLHHSAQIIGRAIVMPNLKQPVTTVEMARIYRNQIIRLLPYYWKFQPLMTLYLTDNTSPEEIVRAKESGIIYGVKLYPAGATTNSDSGVTDIRKVYAVLEKMSAVDMPLLVHGEVTDPGVDIFDRERVFIDRTLRELAIRHFPALRIVLEHVTTQEAVFFVEEVSHVAATITVHHLLENRNAIFQGGLNPHNYCLPVLKREKHRQALLKAATSGNPKFFFGSDSAPHAQTTKETSCGCAGCFTAPAAIELCAEAFDSVGKLEMLEGFTSQFGAKFYGLPENVDRITLIEEDWTMPETYAFGSPKDRVVPFRAGKTIHWKVKELSYPD